MTDPKTEQEIEEEKIKNLLQLFGVKFADAESEEEVEDAAEG